MFKIMIIEDDHSLNKLIKESLEKYNYEVCIPKSLRNLEEEFKELKPDLVLLDINLPYYDGFYLCRAFRRESKVPVIFISARSSDMDQIMAMELGGDDYLVKPFSLEILIAKVKAALRRVYGEYSMTNTPKTEVKSFYIDEDKFRIYYKGQSQDLTKTEFKLMRTLFYNRDKVLAREELLEEMWDETFIANDNALTVNITRIKSKLSSLGLGNIIITKRGVGYYFDTTALTGDCND